MEGVCEHGNYHCSTCEIKLLRLTVNELLADVRAKDEEIEELRDTNITTCNSWGKSIRERIKLEDNLKIAVESLEKYGDMIVMDQEDRPHDVGQLAREALSRINDKED